ncbi:MAG: Gfo/Idh/MocA family oxidoreductase [Eubacteriales bacterium]
MKMAILGAGAIAQKMATTIREMPEITSYAIAARELVRAQAFADEFGFEKAYGSYLEMVEDPEVQLVYVAVPHSFHCDCVKLCLEHGKNVLCEKAFTVNAKQAKELLDMSESKNLLLAEAIWPRYLPMRQMILDEMASGSIGKISSMSANLGYSMETKERIVKPELAGGSLLDLGVYMVNCVSAFFGDDYDNIISTAVMRHQVDMQNAMVMTYPDGRMATVYSTAIAATDREMSINGSEGYIKVQNTNNYESYSVYDVDYNLIKTVEAPAQITGFEYEVMACKNAIDAGSYECAEMPHSEILLMMETMDKLRADWNFKYPGE